MGISKNAVIKIMKKEGAVRVSSIAAEKIVAMLEAKIVEITKSAKEKALFAGRKTIQKKDLE